MNTVQANGKFYIFEHPQNLIEVTESIYNEIKSMQQQYKSLVKTVDADNLPSGEVLALTSVGDLMCGELYIDKGVVWCCSDEGSNVMSITHYIEQKDLIKLMSGE